jgi:hypothetical protein
VLTASGERLLEYQMPTERGIVTRIEADTAWVKTIRTGACEG